MSDIYALLKGRTIDDLNDRELLDVNSNSHSKQC
jgi:hypothetical protein